MSPYQGSGDKTNEPGENVTPTEPLSHGGQACLFPANPLQTGAGCRAIQRGNEEQLQASHILYSIFTSYYV
jgi:hypothetical protein